MKTLFYLQLKVCAGPPQVRVLVQHGEGIGQRGRTGAVAHCHVKVTVRLVFMEAVILILIINLEDGWATFLDTEQTLDKFSRVAYLKSAFLVAHNLHKSVKITISLKFIVVKHMFIRN